MRIGVGRKLARVLRAGLAGMLAEEKHSLAVRVGKGGHGCRLARWQGEPRLLFRQAGKERHGVEGRLILIKFVGK